MSIHLKRLSIICVLAIFLISTKSNSDELKSSKNENHISFETLQTMIQHLDERLSILEEKPQQKEKQQPGAESNNALKNDPMAKVNKRFAKIEKTISILDIKEIQKTLKSFDGILDVFKKRLSELSKRLEDSEVNSAVLEKMYRKTQDYVEPLKTTVSKAREEQSQIVNEDSVDIVKSENIEKLKKPKAFKELTALVGLKQSAESRGLKQSTESRELKQSAESRGLTQSAESGGLKQSAELEGLKQSAESKTLTKSKVSQDIGNGFSAKNVTFEKNGSSSIVKGEIKNNTDSDISSASFTITLFGENGRMISVVDFHMRKIASNAIKPFEETVREVLPSQISRYEIKCRSSF